MLREIYRIQGTNIPYKDINEILKIFCNFDLYYLYGLTEKNYKIDGTYIEEKDGYTIFNAESF